MRLTYIFHSGFVLETSRCVLVFDYWMDPASVFSDFLQSEKDDAVQVTATGSTDSGVSWIITIEGKCIFHAGDLNNWYSRFLAESYHDAQAYSTEFGINIDPLKEEKRYLGELKDIRKKTACFDVAMFPIDGRIGNGYTRGGRQFIETFNVGLFVPMHFAASGFESAWRMKEFTDARHIRFWNISHEGEAIDV